MNPYDLHGAVVSAAVAVEQGKKGNSKREVWEVHGARWTHCMGVVVGSRVIGAR